MNVSIGIIGGSGLYDMAELTDRGLDIRLVAHPIVAAERDKSGKLKNEPA